MNRYLVTIFFLIFSSFIQANAQGLFFTFEPADTIEPIDNKGFFDASGNPNSPCKGGEPFGQCMITDFSAQGVKFTNLWAQLRNQSYPASSGSYQLKTLAGARAFGESIITATNAPFERVTFRISAFPGSNNGFFREDRISIYVNGQIQPSLSFRGSANGPNGQRREITAATIGAPIREIRFEGGFVGIDELALGFDVELFDVEKRNSMVDSQTIPFKGLLTPNKEIVIGQNYRNEAGPVDGVAADGEAQLLVAIPDTLQNKSYRATVLDETKNPVNSTALYGGIGPVLTTRVPRTFSYSTTASSKSLQIGPLLNNAAFFIYRSPEYFSEQSNSNFASRKQRSVFLRIEECDVSGNNCSSIAEKEIKVFRPILALIHGLWATPDSWKFFDPIVQGNSTTRDFDVIFADYSATNAEAISRNATVVYNQFSSHLELWKTQKHIAARQIDVVAHSMGGLIARRINKNNLDAAEFKIINRLISISTPHNGSEFAQRLLDNSTSRCRDLFEKTLNKPIGQAITDLAPGSIELTRELDLIYIDFDASGRRVPQGIPTHTIAGIANETQENAPEGNVLFNSLACRGLLPAGGFDAVFGEDSDLIVSVSSQNGTGLRYSGQLNSTAKYEEPDHQHAADRFLFNEGDDVLGGFADGIVNPVTNSNDDDIQNEVIALLNSAIVQSKFPEIKP